MLGKELPYGLGRIAATNFLDECIGRKCLFLASQFNHLIRIFPLFVGDGTFGTVPLADGLLLDGPPPFVGEILFNIDAIGAISFRPVLVEIPISGGQRNAHADIFTPTLFRYAEH